ncbi:MAG: hypothetical protein AAFU03_14005, partial [Bacteroidota bacterium]
MIIARIIFRYRLVDHRPLAYKNKLLRVIFDTQFELSILDAFGRQVYQTNFTGDQVQLERQKLPAGAYFYRLR